MSYQVLILPRAAKALADLPSLEADRIEAAIRRLAGNPRPAGAGKLHGRQGWRFRVGRYRVIYDIDDAARVATILDVGHRRDIYR